MLLENRREQNIYKLLLGGPYYPNTKTKQKLFQKTIDKYLVKIDINIYNAFRKLN